MFCFDSLVWCVLWRIISNKNCAATVSCNAECGIARDRRFCWWINISSWSTTQEDLTMFLITTRKDFPFWCLQKWMKTTSVDWPNYVSIKEWNFFEWLNVWNFFLQHRVCYDHLIQIRVLPYWLLGRVRMFLTSW